MDFVFFNGNNTLALLLQDDCFRHEFEKFCLVENPFLCHYSCIYEFVKTRIYFIVIYQQQVEGLFNKLNLKTYSNMTENLKESKLRLIITNLDKENLKDSLKDGLKEIHSQRRKSKEVLSEMQENRLNRKFKRQIS
ncbi:hypothetical protein GLOIN_2v1774660 [Rhizophagus clarus]|uniref:Uncharacterized protein n=1 Tax=Rhizophagus clarus TaxID=94130 RepID=A0A8H3LWA0_9GLOM|nr:hypothetical protein GLOIN_2v1774660 [Rhizophagus clarus]